MQLRQHSLSAVTVLALATLSTGCGGGADGGGGTDSLEGVDPAWRSVLAPFEDQVLVREPADLSGVDLPAGVVLERIVLRGPADFAVECLLARPGGEGLPCAVVTGRAIHENRGTLQQMLPLLEAGHAVLVCEGWRGALPAAVESWADNERDVWQRTRAVAALQAAFRFLDGEEWCHPSRRYFLGVSRGANLALSAAVAELRTRLLVLVAPVPWSPEGRLDRTVAPERLGTAQAATRLLTPQVLGPALQDTDSAVVSPSEDRNRTYQKGFRSFLGPPCFAVDVTAPHQFDFRLAMEAGLEEWLRDRLAQPWTPPTTPRDIPKDRTDARRQVMLEEDG